MNRKEGTSLDGTPSAALLRSFLLSWLAVSGAGTLFLFFALYLIFSGTIKGEYASVFYAMRHLSDFMFPMFAITMLAYILLVGGAAAVICVISLHRVAGPLFRLEKALETLLTGAAVKPVFFRERDQFPALASAFNGFVGSLREDRQRWLGVMEHADRLCLQDRETCRAEMEKALDELETLLSRYR